MFNIHARREGASLVLPPSKGKERERESGMLRACQPAFASGGSNWGSQDVVSDPTGSSHANLACTYPQRYVTFICTLIKFAFPCYFYLKIFQIFYQVLFLGAHNFILLFFLYKMIFLPNYFNILKQIELDLFQGRDCDKLQIIQLSH